MYNQLWTVNEHDTLDTLYGESEIDIEPEQKSAPAADTQDRRTDSSLRGTANLTGMLLADPLYAHGMVYIPGVYNDDPAVLGRA